MLGIMEQFHSILISIMSKWRTQIVMFIFPKSAFSKKKCEVKAIKLLALGYMSQQIFRGCEEMAEAS